MRIMPSGNGSFDWLPKSSSLVKTASSETVESEEAAYRDELFKAAKMFAQAEEEMIEADSDAVEFESDIEDGDSEVVDCLERAKDAIEDAMECVDGGDDEEIELEIEDTSLEEEDEIDEVEVSDEEECCEECECEPCECVDGECEDDDEDDDDDDDDDDVEAGYNCASDNESEACGTYASSNKWTKLSAISPGNRKKIYDYWTKSLGYPKDFVKLLVKDYEK